jgi:hypothetical protein
VLTPAFTQAHDTHALPRPQVRLVYSGAGDAMLVLSAEQVRAPPRRIATRRASFV